MMEDMSEHESLYLGVEAEMLPPEEIIPTRRMNEIQTVRAEIRPLINEARRKIAERVLVELTEDNWRAASLCAYLSEREKQNFTASTKSEITRAKLFCEGCAVRHECLDKALDDNETMYVYGGLSATERRRMRRRDVLERRLR